MARGVVPVGLEPGAPGVTSGTVVPGDGDAAGVVPVGDGPAGSVSGAGSVTGAGTSGSVPGGRTGGSAGCVPSGSATGSVESVKSMTLPVAFVACSRTWIVKPASSAVAVYVVPVCASAWHAPTLSQRCQVSMTVVPACQVPGVSVRTSPTRTPVSGAS